MLKDILAKSLVSCHGFWEPAAGWQDRGLGIAFRGATAFIKHYTFAISRLWPFLLWVGARGR
jgi:hypothetical protein